MGKLIAIDPGRHKCGLVLSCPEKGLVLEGRVVHAGAVIDLITLWKSQFNIDLILLGNGTSSDYWEEKLTGVASLEVVEESNTTLKARKRYWELWPPQDFTRFLPRGLVLPKENLDAVAALIILENYLGKKLCWKGSKKFKT